MQKLIKSYLTIWYAPILSAVGIGFLGILTIQYPNEIVLYLSLGLPFLAILTSGTVGLFRIFKKDYKTGFLQIGLTTIVAGIGFVFISAYLIFYPYDFYADNLKIPENIELNEPRGEKFSEIVVHSSMETYDKPLETPTKIDFELRNSFQPGLYEFDAWIGKVDSGKIFLKAFEITQNAPLSSPYLKRKSTVKVVNTTDSLLKFSISDHFTIYEGDWGKPYAARFELWYKPNHSNNEILLTEKNYKIEGWMR